MPRREYARIETLGLLTDDAPPRRIISTPHLIAFEQRAWEPSTSEKWRISIHKNADNLWKIKHDALCGSTSHRCCERRVVE